MTNHGSGDFIALCPLPLESSDKLPVCIIGYGRYDENEEKQMCEVRASIVEYL